jgi:hypothetical protein
MFWCCSVSNPCNDVLLSFCSLTTGRPSRCSTSTPRRDSSPPPSRSSPRPCSVSRQSPRYYLPFVITLYCLVNHHHRRPSHPQGRGQCHGSRHGITSLCYNSLLSSDSEISIGTTRPFPPTVMRLGRHSWPLCVGICSKTVQIVSRKSPRLGCTLAAK